MAFTQVYITITSFLALEQSTYIHPCNGRLMDNSCFSIYIVLLELRYPRGICGLRCAAGAGVGKGWHLSLLFGVRLKHRKNKENKSGNINQNTPSFFYKILKMFLLWDSQKRFVIIITQLQCIIMQIVIMYYYANAL